jgi:hypothetical protein
MQRNRGDQLLNLENASTVRRREAAQIHQHGICSAGEARDGHSPGVVMAEKVLYAEQPVGIGYGDALRKTTLQIVLVLDERAA